MKPPATQVIRRNYETYWHPGIIAAKGLVSEGAKLAPLLIGFMTPTGALWSRDQRGDYVIYARCNKEAHEG